METKDITLNGVGFLLTYDLGSMKNMVNYLHKELFEEGNVSHKLYSVDHESTDDELLADLGKVESIVASIENGTFDFESAVGEVRKKKNGKFWSRSNADIAVFESITEYFTDFTNAWSMLGFRVGVTGETTATLELNRRTYTL